MLKRYFALFAALLLMLSLFSACDSTGRADARSSATPSAPAQPSSTVSPTSTSTPSPSASSAPAESGSYELTDMAGRVMTVPANIETAFSTTAAAAIYIYTLAPERLLGWNYKLNDTELKFIPEEYHTLPVFGQGDSINDEALIAANPSVILNVTGFKEGTLEASDKLAERLGIPVVMLSDAPADAPEVYRFLGELFGLRDRAGTLAAYAEKTYADVAALAIPEEQKLRIYYGNGEDSLETAPAGSPHARTIDRVGGINAAELELGDGSRVRISLEQLLAWNPEVIIVNGEPKAGLSGGAAAAEILARPELASLKAIQNEMVFGIPNVPFSWTDRPSGPNHLIGVRWLAKKLYPDALSYDLDEEVREFFSLFYHIELTDTELREIYND